MWLSLVIAVLSYLLSPRNTAAERRNALLGAAAAGAVTYGVTEYTDWGKENLGPLNGALTPAFMDKALTVSKDDAAGGGKIAPTVGSSGFWDALKSWGPSGVSAVIGTAAVASGALNKYIPWAVGGLGLFLLMRN